MWLERYLGLFSYMRIEQWKNLDQWGFRAFKATAYIPVFGTISCFALSIALLIFTKKASYQVRKKEKTDGAFFALRATLALTPPLLLIVEGVTTVADAIFRARRQSGGSKAVQKPILGVEEYYRLAEQRRAELDLLQND